MAGGITKRSAVWIILALVGALLLAPTMGATTPTVHGAVSSPALPTGVSGGGWSVAALSAAPRSTVADSEAGIALPGAVDLGPASVPSLMVLVSFPLTHSAQLSQFLAALSDPHSPGYHHYLTASEFDSQYGGSAGPYHSAVQYFESFGISGLTTAADHLTLTFHATPTQVGAIFHTRVDTFAFAGHSYYAPVSPLSLPAPLASSISTVKGLSSYSQYLIHTLGHLSSPRSLPPPPGHPSSPVQPTDFLAPGYFNGTEYEFAPDFQVAYDELSLFADSGYPSNMVAATILWSGNDSTGAPTAPFDPTDIYDFFNETIPAGEPHASVYGVPLNGAPAPGPSAQNDVTGANGENTLDLEMLGSTAPGASIFNVYGPTSSDVNLDAAFSYVLNPTNTPALQSVSVISNSWGGLDGNDSVWFTGLQEAQARGITVLASSGDSGSNPASSKWDGSYAEFPSSMAFDAFGVTAVGGTTVSLNGDSYSPTYLHLASQIVWYISSADYADGGPAGSSGGISSVFPEPSWQTTTSANNVILGAGRGVPDVAALANNTLVTITVSGQQFVATNIYSGGPFYSMWGTSVAAPLEAGIVTEMDHVLQAHSNPLLGFLNPQLYPLADTETAPLVNTTTTGYDLTGGYASALPTLPLIDVVEGANYLYPAQRGYDLATGWGSIDAYNYTMYFLTVPSTGVYGRLSGVEDLLTLNGLGVTSYFPNGSVNTAYNASIQQNFFLANSLGAPIYWVQNVIYITEQNGQWAMWYTGWVIYPFYGIYYSLSIYEFNFPSGQFVTLPQSFDVQTVLETPTGFNAQYVAFSVGSATVQLPVPGAAYIIGSLSYQYSWQGVTYVNGPSPNNPVPGGLSPQFGLVGGPSAATGYFTSPTSGSLTAKILPYGQTTFVGASTMAYGYNTTCQNAGTCIDQTGEIAANLAWTAQSSSQWTLGISSGSTLQGVLSYEPSTTTTYTATFTETGLAAGASWSVTFNGATQSGSSGTSIAFSGVVNGTYSFSVSAAGYAANPSSGSLNVAGTDVSQAIAFTPVSPGTYTVTFTETGLVLGAGWSVTFNGGTQSGSGSSITFAGVVNGTYSFSVSATGYRANPSAGSLHVAGSDVSQAITFTSISPGTYTVTFTETGLAGGASWSVTFHGATQSGSGGTPIAFSGIVNGTYSFSVNAAGYTANPASGQLTVSGGDVSQAITFTSSGGGGGSGGGFLGLPGNTGYYAVGAILVIVVIALAVGLALRSRRRTRLTPPPAAPGPAYPVGPGPGGFPPANAAFPAPSQPPYGAQPYASLPPPPPFVTPPVPPPPAYAPPPPPPTRARFCRNCGHPFATDARFCPSCGSPRDG